MPHQSSEEASPLLPHFVQLIVSRQPDTRNKLSPGSPRYDRLVPEMFPSGGNLPTTISPEYGLYGR
jgi:hypothetical protein